MRHHALQQGNERIPSATDIEGNSQGAPCPRARRRRRARAARCRGFDEGLRKDGGRPRHRGGRRFRSAGWSAAQHRAWRSAATECRVAEGASRRRGTRGWVCNRVRVRALREQVFFIGCGRCGQRAAFSKRLWARPPHDASPAAWRSRARVHQARHRPQPGGRPAPALARRRSPEALTRSNVRHAPKRMGSLWRSAAAGSRRADECTDAGGAGARRGASAPGKGPSACPSEVRDSSSASERLDGMPSAPRHRPQHGGSGAGSRLVSGTLRELETLLAGDARRPRRRARPG